MGQFQISLLRKLYDVIIHQCWMWFEFYFAPKWRRSLFLGDDIKCPIAWKIAFFSRGHCPLLLLAKFLGVGPFWLPALMNSTADLVHLGQMVVSETQCKTKGHFASLPSLYDYTSCNVLTCACVGLTLVHQTLMAITAGRHDSCNFIYASFLRFNFAPAALLKLGLHIRG